MPFFHNPATNSKDTPLSSGRGTQSQSRGRKRENAVILTDTPVKELLIQQKKEEVFQSKKPIEEKLRAGGVCKLDQSSDDEDNKPIPLESE